MFMLISILDLSYFLNIIYINGQEDLDIIILNFTITLIYKLSRVHCIIQKAVIIISIIKNIFPCREKYIFLQ
jgi:hypothetical protein